MNTKINTKGRDGDQFCSDSLLPQLKQLALRGTGTTVYANTFNYAVQMIGTIILARALTPEDYGLVAMVIVIGLFLANYGVNGFTEAIIQEDNIDHAQTSCLFWINTIISAALTLIFMAMAPIMARLFNDHRIVKITLVSAIMIIVSGLATQHLALLQRKMQFQYIAAITVFSVIISTVTSISMAWLGFGYWSLIAKYIIYSASITIGAWIFCKWRPGYPSNFTRVKSIVQFAVNAYLTFCVTYLSRNLDKVLVGKFHGSLALGQYDRAYQLSGIFYNQLALPLSSVAIATLSRIRNDPGACLAYYIRVLSAMSFVAMPISAIFALIGHDLTLLILGNQWHMAGNIFMAFAPCAAPMLVYSTHAWLHYSLGRADRLFRWTVLATLITIFLVIVAVPYGGLGVAVAVSASYYLISIPGLLYAGQPIQLRLSHILSAVSKYFVAAFLAWILCFCLYLWPPVSGAFRNTNIVLRILLSSTFCLIIYIGILAALCRSFTLILYFIAVFTNIALAPFRRSKDIEK